jgi:hypothetical protein
MYLSIYIYLYTSASVAPQATSMSNEHVVASDNSNVDGRGIDSGIYVYELYRYVYIYIYLYEYVLCIYTECICI